MIASPRGWKEVRSLGPVAVDLGYGWTKALSGGRTFLEQSVVGPADEVIEGLGPVAGVRLWDEDGTEYFIGELAVRHCQFPWFSLADDKPVDANTLRLLRAALAGVVEPRSGQVDIPVVVTGLPVNMWARQRTAIEQLLTGFRRAPIVARLGTEPIQVEVTVQSVKVLAQPFGTFLDLVLDEQGEVRRPELARTRTLVVDVGFHTVDLLALDGLEIISKLSISTNFGLASAYTAVARNLNLPVWELDHRARQGRVPGLDAALQHLAGNVARTVEGLNERFGLYLVTGGGGPVLFPHLRFAGRAELAANAQLANVRGYLKVGERLWRQKVSGPAG